MKVAARMQDVKVVLVDDESLMRQIIMNALAAGGYREVRSVFRLAQFREAIESANPDLLIINGEMADGDPVELVRQIRLGRIGRNPFIPVIMTSWHSEGEFVRRVVDGGIDVLMTKPFAAGQLFARIDFLVSSRPAFVATASYIGPDRRKARRDDTFPRFDVPNTLRDRLEGQALNPEDTAALISRTFALIKRHRRQMQESDMGRHFTALSQAVREAQATDECRHLIEALTRSARLYLAEMPAGTKAKEPAKALAARLGQLAVAIGRCSLEDCNQVADLIAEIGNELPSEAEAVFTGGGGDIVIQSCVAA